MQRTLPRHANKYTVSVNCIRETIDTIQNIAKNHNTMKRWELNLNKRIDGKNLP